LPLAAAIADDDRIHPHHAGVVVGRTVVVVVATVVLAPVAGGRLRAIAAVVVALRRGGQRQQATEDQDTCERQRSGHGGRTGGVGMDGCSSPARETPLNRNAGPARTPVRPMGQPSNSVSRLIGTALSALDTGQFCLASSATARNFTSSMP